MLVKGSSIYGPVIVVSTRHQTSRSSAAPSAFLVVNTQPQALPTYAEGNTCNDAREIIMVVYSLPQASRRSAARTTIMVVYSSPHAPRKTPPRTTCTNYDRIFMVVHLYPQAARRTRGRTPLMMVVYPLPPASYTHLRAHQTLRYLVFRLLLEKKI